MDLKKFISRTLVRIHHEMRAGGGQGENGQSKFK